MATEARAVVKVLNLSKLIKSDVLTAFLSFVGQVVSVTLQPSASNTPTNEAIVEFGSVQEASLALHLTGTVLGDKTLFVVPPTAQHQPPAGELTPAGAAGAAGVMPASVPVVPLGQSSREVVERTLYSGNLHSGLTTEELWMLFSACGKVTQIKMAGDPTHSTRYAFVEFETYEDATSGLSLHGTIVAGRAIK
ncbi:hypothetical protein HK105_207046 [Polyrhizophydium stewartii]|uniref:RRM domain-containing protein n=1 Tax=Polyrhizophydium stewartii TaxID=2732419 RepID=A0ABR4N1Q3_9FUNG